MEETYLEIQEAGKIRQVPLGDDPMTIGRHSDNRLVISDTMASRFHCHISKSPNGAFMLRDMNSSNGTALNGKLVKYCQLASGDTIAIGNLRMKFVSPNGEHRPGPDRGISIVELGRADQVGVPKSEPTQEPAGDGPEMLTDDDIVEDEPGIELEPARAMPDLDAIEDEFTPLPPEDDSPIPIDDFLMPIQDEPATVEEEDRIAVAFEDQVLEMGDLRDPKQIVTALVESLPDKPFEQSEIALVSARGQIVHAAGISSVRDNREAVDWLRLLLVLCSRSRATDVHFEPKGNDYVLRMRVDGTMVETCRIPNALGTRLSALVKVLSDIDIAQKNAIQEGHFSARVPRGQQGHEDRIDYRVSFAPSVFGQKLVIRVLDTSYAPLHVRNLQLPSWMCSEVERVIKQDAGMVLVCGPTGSGKTTSLYALIRGSGIEQRNVVTIEDPVEIQIEGVTQIPVDDEHQKSFSTLLRSTLRQDPDVILIGEIRDAETARIAMQAAITGHLVFSTVHAQNTTGTIFRLLDLGAEPYLVAQALHLVLAQRLVRQLCPYCKFPVRPTPDQIKKMGKAGIGVSRIYEKRACIRCLNTGFSGRRAIFELLTATDELRDLITRTPTAAQIHAALATTPFQRLQNSGYQLVAQGVVPFEEIERVVGRDA
jgi:general secretion pathway protein E